MMSGSVFAYGGYRGSFQLDDQAVTTDTESDEVTWGPGSRFHLTDDVTPQYGMRAVSDDNLREPAQGTMRSSRGIHTVNSTSGPSRMSQGKSRNVSVSTRGSKGQANQASYNRMDPEDCLYLETGARQYLNQSDTEAFTGRQGSGRMGRAGF